MRVACGLVTVLTIAAATACTPAAVRPAALDPTATASTPVSNPPAVTPSPSSPSPSSPVVSVATPSASSCGLPVSRWSAWQLAGAVLLAPARLDNLSASARMVASGVGGIVLFGPIAGDVGAQLRSLHVAAGAWPLVVASDEEGGGIQRLASLTGALPWPRSMAASGPTGIRSMASTMGERLRALTVRMDLAPVADLDDGPGPDARHPVGRRSFSADPAVASADVVAFAQGLRDAGVVPVVKHFPGLGTATTNTDVGAATTSSLSALRGRDLAPYAAAIRAGVPAVMMSNAVVPGLSSLPASLSSAAVDLLRRDLGFRGVIVTDSLSAGAIRAAGFTPAAAAVRALAAGADEVILGSGDTTNPEPLVDATRTAIADAVASGRLSASRLRDAVRRIAALMGAPTC